MGTLVLLPWHLGEPLPPSGKVLLLLLQDHDRRLPPIHKLKLAWNMAICREFVRRRRGVEIVDWDRMVRSVEGPVTIYDPLDHDLADELASAFPGLTVLPLKNSFVMSEADLRDAYHARAAAKTMTHAAFFKIVKEKTGALVGVASTDSENRRPLPASRGAPADLAFANSGRAKKTCAECIAYVDARFASNPGSAEQLMRLPITRRDAVKYFDAFLDRKLADYGAYQDAIDKDAVELYHSHCSHLINAGLLSPRLVVRKAMSRASRVKMNSIEGFVRQVLGWREYMRFIYRFWGRELKARMLAEPGGTRLDFEAWTRAATGIAPIDGEIRKVLRHAWSHHIVRLMIFMNFMKLTDVRPLDIYRWFMSLVSLDAYEWVMVSNIMAMGYFDTRFTTRHYVSSSKYVLRMSNYEKDGRWEVLWDRLYKAYVAKHGLFGNLFSSGWGRSGPTPK